MNESKLAVASLLLACAGLFAWPSPADEKTVDDAAAQPLALHPDNPGYFLFRGKPTVLVTSGEHYGVLLNQAFDYAQYFDELADCGLNHSRVFNGSYREVEASFNITENPLAPTNENFLAPWARSEKSHQDGSPIFDLDKWDDAYFARLKKLVADASSHDIVLEITLFSPMYTPGIWNINPMNVRNNINGIGDCGPNDLFTGEDAELLAVQTRFATKMVQELNAFDNLYLEICNEPYFGGVTDAWQRKIIDAVVQTQEEIGCRKLISVNVANGSKKVVDPHPAVSIFNFHYCHPPSAVSENRELKKLIGENETGFRGSADLLYRTEGWDFLVAGGALYNNLDYSFSAGHPRGTLAGYTSPGGGSRQLRAQLGLLKKTFDRLPLVELQPQDSGMVKASDNLVVSAIGKPGDQYIVYAHVKLPGKLTDQPLDNFRQTIESAELKIQLPPGRYRLAQLDPVTGESRDLPELTSRDQSMSTV